MKFKGKNDIYRYMIESSGDIVFLLDNDDRFAFLNDQVESLLGFARQELLGKKFDELVHHSDLEHADLNFHSYSESAGHGLSRGLELRLRHKNPHNDFRYFDIKMSNVPEDISKAYSNVIFTGRRRTQQIVSFGVARDITRLKLFEELIFTNANYDYLTGLPNRVLLKDRVNLTIARVKRESGKFVVMFFDLDGFKQVNDRCGHSAGDLVLQTVSNRLKACLREADTLARIGGDEFMLLLPDIHDTAEVKKIADKLLNEFYRPFVINGHRFELSASIGVAFYPDNGETFDDLINGADRAMYHVKHGSKNGYIFLSDIPEVDKQGNVFSFN